MTNLHTLAAEIASQLDGTARLTDEGGDRLSADLAFVDLANERDGLRVVLRLGMGTERNRVRATMSYTRELRGDLDYRAMPAFHTIETAAAMSRGAAVIARQIEAKAVQPAIPMLEAWKLKRAEIDAEAQRMAATVERWRARFPRAQIELDRSDKTSATLRMSAPTTAAAADYWYMNADLRSDGGIYIRQMSALPEAAAMAMLELMGRK